MSENSEIGGDLLRQQEKDIEKQPNADVRKPREEESDEDDLIACPNLNTTDLTKGTFFDKLEKEWLEYHVKRIEIPHEEFHQHSELGKINLKEWSLVEDDKTIAKGHHALCGLIRHKPTGILYRCKVISAKRIHFNLTTLGFKKSEYETEAVKMLRERNFLFSVKNPFIRHGLGFFTDDSYNVGMILEEFPHGTLLDYYSKSDNNKVISNFEEEDVKFIAAQIILGLEYLHGINIVHRDIQAGNILVDSKGYIKLTDLGIATCIPKDGRLYSVTCFRYYAAPEFFTGKGYTCAVDVYALGLTLYELLTGECFSEQEDIFDMDGSVDWGILPEDLEILIKQANQYKDETTSNNLEDITKTSENRQKQPSIEARNFVEDCLIHEDKYRPDKKTARFYDWYKNINFEQLYRKEIALPWKPSKKISYEPDIDEEYPKDMLLDQSSFPSEFENFKNIF